ncbi:hypothetical protein BDN72DRAFT_840082 [Pluteus cervinus]|uniref:Uncharacterized protein n=1 Tax=Pluteus cervinus TaxID=181527 RepID=A0ACD3AUT7_9AGAR|nr:hypothetical protein BDN72DRAFT_840082 [Pluteus cervinus]
MVNGQALCTVIDRAAAPESRPKDAAMKSFMIEPTALIPLFIPSMLDGGHCQRGETIGIFVSHAGTSSDENPLTELGIGIQVSTRSFVGSVPRVEPARPITCGDDEVDSDACVSAVASCWVDEFVIETYEPRQRVESMCASKSLMARSRAMV